MIFATSNGLSSPQLLDILAPFVKKEQKGVLVTTAAVGQKEKSGDVPILRRELEHFGITVDFFDFDRDPVKKLLAYDVVEMIGGNPFYLLKAIQGRKAEKILQTISQEKVLIGVSGGALVLQNSLDLVYRFLPWMNKKPALEDFTALSLMEVEIFPHRGRFIAQHENFEERVALYEKETQRKVFLLEDGQGVMVDKGKTSVIL